MLRVVAPSIIDTDKLPQYYETVRELIEKSNQEEGCIYYTLNKDVKDPAVHYISECWKDKAALDAHMQTEHFKRIVPLLSEYVVERKEMILMEEAEL